MQKTFYKMALKITSKTIKVYNWLTHHINNISIDASVIGIITTVLTKTDFTWEHFLLDK